MNDFKKLALPLAATLVALLPAGLITPARAADARPMKLLVVTTTLGFRHSSIPTAEKVLAELAEQSGGEFSVEFVRQPSGQPAHPKKPNPSDPTAQQKFESEMAAYETAEAQWQSTLKEALAKLSPESLKSYDGVVFANTSGDLPLPDKDGFLAWIKSGKAFIGIHSASDTFHGWPGFIEMLGGEFDHHGPQVGCECTNADTKHPATRQLGLTWAIPQEEIYQFKNYGRERVHELLVLDAHPNDKTPGHFPISWCREYGNGKVFYTSLGHREDIWDADPALHDRINPVAISKAYQQHLRGGILWALGLGK